MNIKYILPILFILIISLNAYSFRQDDVYHYIEKYKSTALKFEKEYGIPATITLAQGILESSAGTSGLTKASNNHFGIKAGSSWKGPIHQAWDDEPQKSHFRAYSSPEDSFRDYARLISTSKYYRPLFSINIYDYRGWAYGLKKAGYATAPHYAQALIGLIEHYRLYAINGGVKLRPGKIVVITKYMDIEKPIFDEGDILRDDEVTEEESIITEAITHYVVSINDIHCTVVQPGENLASVARRYDISPAELLKYNELTSEKQVKEGSILFLGKKRKRYCGAQDIYITKTGETLYDVSQQFGIQLHQLAKLNNIGEYTLLKSGIRLNLK